MESGEGEETGGWRQGEEGGGREGSGGREGEGEGSGMGECGARMKSGKVKSREAPDTWSKKGGGWKKQRIPKITREAKF